MVSLLHKVKSEENVVKDNPMSVPLAQALLKQPQEPSRLCLPANKYILSSLQSKHITIVGQALPVVL